MSSISGARRVVVSAPQPLASKIAGRLHMYYDTKTEDADPGYCEIYTIVEGRKLVVCQFESDLGVSNIMTLFRVKARQLGLA